MSFSGCISVLMTASNFCWWLSAVYQELGDCGGMAKAALVETVSQ